jgi:hypothetical protein
MYIYFECWRQDKENVYTTGGGGVSLTEVLQVILQYEDNQPENRSEFVAMRCKYITRAKIIVNWRILEHVNVLKYYGCRIFSTEVN